MRRLPYLILGLATAAQAEGVVLSTTAPGVAVGSVIQDQQSVHLPDGAMVAVLLSGGQVVKLTGPFDGPIDVREHGGASQFLTDWRGTDLSNLGGARGGAGSEAVMPVLSSVIDATRAGTWCALSQGSLQIKPPATDSATLQLQDSVSGATARLVWPPARGEQPWPQSLPVTDGATILARWNEGGTPTRLTFRIVPGGGSIDSLIHWAAAGCQSQIEPGLRSLGQKIVPLSLFLSTERGRSPHYAVGESVNLVVQVNRPAALYCAILQEGRARPLFPESGGRHELADQTPLHITADHLPVDITAPPPRQAELRCYAVPPDAQTKARIDWPGIAAGSDATSGRLDQSFAALPDTAVATDHLVVTTE